MDDVNLIFSIIKKNLFEKYKKQPAHTLEELQTLKKLYKDRKYYIRSSEEN